MRFIYGSDYSDVANRELATDSARDSRYFNSLASNRAAQAQRQQQDRDAAATQLDWQRLLANAAIAAQSRNDELDQRAFSNQLGLARFNQDVAGSGRNQSNVLAELALRKREQDLRYGPDHQSEVALGKFEKLAPYLADNPAITEDTIASLRPDLNPSDLPVAKAIFSANRRDVMNQDTERGNVTDTTNARIANIQRGALATEMGPTITQDTVPPGAGSRGWYNPARWFGSRATPEDAAAYRAKVLANIMAGEFDPDLQPMPAKEASQVFRDVNRNQALAMSPYDAESGRFQFTPRFSAAPSAQLPAIVQAPLDPLQRHRGVIYQTPKGALRWTGTGWMAP